MVTQEQINRLKKELEMRKKKISRIEEFIELSKQRKKLEKDIKRVKDPKAFLRREKTKDVLKKIGRAELTGLKFIGKQAFRGLKATGKHLVEVAQEQNRRDQMQRMRQMKRTKAKSKKRKR